MWPNSMQVDLEKYIFWSSHLLYKQISHILFLQLRRDNFDLFQRIYRLQHIMKDVANNNVVNFEQVFVAM